jgi:hypothetical protein
MGTLLRLIFTPLGLVLIGLVAGGVGIFLTMEGRNGTAPERAELTQVSGSVKNITKKWKEKYGSKRDVKYEIEIATANGAITKVTVPEKHLTEDQAQALFRSPVKAMIKGTDYSHVWELTAGPVVFIDYAKSRKEHVESLAEMAQNGPYVAGGGLIALLVGATWFVRRRSGDTAA